MLRCPFHANRSRFLWVIFQLDAICAQSTDADIAQALQDLPKSLPGVFQRVLSRLDSEPFANPDLRRRLVSLVGAAQRPLTVGELREALSVIPGQLNWDPATQITDARKAVTGAGSLLTIDEEDGTVRFAHQSVRQFFFQESTRTIGAKHVGNLSECDLFMGQTCVTYLTLGIFDKQLMKKDDQQRINTRQVTEIVVGRVTPSAINALALKLLRSRKTPGSDLENQLRSVRQQLHTVDTVHEFLQYAQDNFLFHTKAFDTIKQDKTYHMWKRLLHGTSPAINLPWGPQEFAKLSKKIIDWAFANDHDALIQIMHEELIYLFKSKGSNSMQELFDLLPGETYDHGLPGLGIFRLVTMPKILFSDTRGFQATVVETPVSLRKQLHGCPVFGAVVAATITGSPREEWVDVMLGLSEPSAGRTNCLNAILLNAALHGWLRVVQFMVDCSAPRNLRLEITTPEDSSSESPLLHSAGHLSNDTHLESEGASRLTPSLLQMIYDINTRDDIGRTAIILAADLSHLGVVKCLLRHPAINVNAVTDTGRTALSISAGQGTISIVRFLLDFGSADVNLADNAGVTPLMYAIDGGHEGVATLLLAHKDIQLNLHDASGSTELHHAISAGAIKLLKNLLNRSEIVVDAVDGEGQSILHIAARRKTNRNGVDELFEILLRVQGLDINAADHALNTAFHHACGPDQHYAFRALLDDFNLNVNATNAAGQTGLHILMERQDDDKLKQLLAHDMIDVNVQDHTGRTAEDILLQSLTPRLQEEVKRYANVLDARARLLAIMRDTIGHLL
jgi:ankyrin repeat protein